MGRFVILGGEGAMFRGKYFMANTSAAELQ